MAERIQRKRSKGWRMPAGAVYVGRGSQWGNPFVVDPKRAVGWPDFRANVDLWASWPVPDAPTAVLAYREMCLTPRLIESARKALRGKDLACWCHPGQPCHADVLLEIAGHDGEARLAVRP